MIQNKNKQKNGYSNRIDSMNLRIITLCIIVASFSLTQCSSTPEEMAPGSDSVAQENTTPVAKVAEPELSEKEKQDIDAKIEKLKKLPIKNLIENIKATKGYERKQTWAALEEVLNVKLLKFLKKEFPDSKDVLELPIYDPSGVETYSNMALKDLFMIYFSQHPDTGATISKKILYLTRNKKEQTVTYILHPPNDRDSQDFIFKLFNGKLILSKYKSGIQVNPTGYEYASSEIFSMMSLKESGYMPRLESINQTLVDSIK